MPSGHDNQVVAVLLYSGAVPCRTLRAATQKQCSRGQVIWYDAVTSEGKLTWQNSLNALNRRFFDACDSIFVNYAWKVTYICNRKADMEL